MNMGQSEPHILITGANRSGTTWVGRTVSLHSRVRYVHEPFNVSHPNNETNFKLDKWFTYAPAATQRETIELSFDRLFDGSPIHVAARTCARVGLDIKTPFRFAKHLFLQTVYPQRILVKDPIALLSAGWLYERFGFSVVCMIRQPLAFVGSLKKAGWKFDFTDILTQETLMQTVLAPYYDRVAAFCRYPGDIVDQAALLWNLLHFVILEYQKTYPSWLFVQYESLAAAPLKGFQEIFNHLDLTLSDDIRETIDMYTSTENPTEPGTTQYQPRNARASLQTWKNRLNPEEVDRVISQTRELASKFYDDLEY